jgi:hypothetical protein
MQQLLNGLYYIHSNKVREAMKISPKLELRVSLFYIRFYIAT